ncbi:hypothetical protein D3C71_2096360 [compost metagenome]
MTSMVPSKVRMSRPYCTSQPEATQYPANAAIRFERIMPGFVTVMKSRQLAPSLGDLADRAAESEEA